MPCRTTRRPVGGPGLADGVEEGGCLQLGLGLLLVGVGAILILTWFIKPLRAVWPWFRALPWPIQAGLGAAAVGFLILMGSVIWERLEDLEKERHYTDDL